MAYFEGNDIIAYIDHWNNHLHGKSSCGRDGGKCKNLRHRVLEESREILLAMYPEIYMWNYSKQSSLVSQSPINESAPTMEISKGDYGYVAPESGAGAGASGETGTGTDGGGGGGGPGG